MEPTKAIMALRPSITFETFNVLKKLTYGATEIGINVDSLHRTGVDPAVASGFYAYASRVLVRSKLACWTDGRNMLIVTHAGELVYTAYVQQLELMQALDVLQTLDEEG